MRSCLVALSLAVAVPAFAQDGGAAPDAAAAPAAAADAASYAATLDTLWKTRDAAQSLKDADAAIRDGLKAFPNDYGILWRAARFRWWVADGPAEERLKKQTAKEGWNYAKRAADANPAGVEGKYFVALNIGAYSQAVGILKALSEGLEGQFVDNLDGALKIDEAYDRYGGRTAKGRYHWELPWPKRDLGKSKAELQKSIDKHPEHLRNWLYLADTLLKDGDAKGAKTAIDKAITGADAYDPPEARRVKGWAKTLGEKIDAELK